MWRVWQLIDVRQALVANAVFLFSLAIVIHFVLLSTDRFNWLEGPSTASTTTSSAAAVQQSALPGA